MSSEPVTLQELLDSRERRVQKQKSLLSQYEGVLISVTLNIPGPVKDKPAYRKALQAAMELLAERFAGDPIIYKEVRYLKTGAEGYFVAVGAKPEEVKTLTVEIEDGTPLGRLFDMDVLTEKGSISRSDLGKPGRRCLLCDEDAKVCARSQRHPMELLLAEIDRILEETVF
ncbi:citrate lyase holo-[acyl-carrier protein] synthase [Anaerovoracaceae bacterium 42-11]